MNDNINMDSTITGLMNDKINMYSTIAGLNFLLYYVMMHVDAGGNPASHCHLVPGRHPYAVCTVQ